MVGSIFCLSVFLASLSFASPRTEGVRIEKKAPSTEKKPQQALWPATLLSGKVSILVPVGFELMDPATLAMKYPLKDPGATEVYTNGPATVNLAIEHTEAIVAKENLNMIQEGLNERFGHPSFDLISNTIETIHGREYILVEVITPAMNATIYNLMFATVLDGRLLFGTFNCTLELREAWETTAKEIVHSVKIKE